MAGGWEPICKGDEDTRQREAGGREAAASSIQLLTSVSPQLCAQRMHVLEGAAKRNRLCPAVQELTMDWSRWNRTSVNTIQAQIWPVLKKHKTKQNRTQRFEPSVMGAQTRAQMTSSEGEQEMPTSELAVFWLIEIRGEELSAEGTLWTCGRGGQQEGNWQFILVD